MKKTGIFSESFVENVHICKTLHEFYFELGFCQYQDCLTKYLHTVSVLTKRFLLSILPFVYFHVFFPLYVQRAIW